MTPDLSMTIIASGMVSRIGPEVAFACSQRLFELLLLVDVERDSAEVMRRAVLGPDQAGTHANPMARSGLCGDREGNVELATGFDRSPDGLHGAFAIWWLEQRKEKIVADRLFAWDAKKQPGIVRPGQLLRQKIEVPRPDAGLLDSEPETLVTNGVIERRLGSVGHAPPSLREFILWRLPETDPPRSFAGLAGR